MQEVITGDFFFCQYFDLFDLTRFNLILIVLDSSRAEGNDNVVNSKLSGTPGTVTGSEVFTELPDQSGDETDRVLCLGVFDLTFA